MGPNISTSRDDHRLHCHAHHGYYRPADAGTVRRCEHDVVQILSDLGGYLVFRDLSPLWTPILYRRAVAALSQRTGAT